MGNDAAKACATWARVMRSGERDPAFPVTTLVAKTVAQALRDWISDRERDNFERPQLLMLIAVQGRRETELGRAKKKKTY